MKYFIVTAEEYAPGWTRHHLVSIEDERYIILSSTRRNGRWAGPQVVLVRGYFLKREHPIMECIGKGRIRRPYINDETRIMIYTPREITNEEAAMVLFAVIQ